MTKPNLRMPNGLCYGIYSKHPDLPAGYRWIETPHDWVLVRDETKKIWFVRMIPGGTLLVARKEVGWWKWIRTLGELKLGTIYADYQDTLYLPNPTAKRNG